MNKNYRNNHSIPVEHLLAEQHPHVDNEQRENSAQNRSNSSILFNVTEKKRNSSMTPTPLYNICFFLNHHHIY